MIILDNVSLITVSSTKIPETEAAIRQCLQHIRFGEVVFFTDKHVTFPRIIIPEIKSKREYSYWIIHQLGKHLQTPFALICQWDGFVVNHKAWTNEFLNYDYIGSPWPPWEDNNYRPDTVGNGGFSLRSKKLCDLVSRLAPACFENEDRVICEDRREQLENQGIKFAPVKLAWQFSCENDNYEEYHSFGIHGERQRNLFM